MLRICFTALSLLAGTTAFAQQFSAPVVARVEMQLKVGEETIDVIEKGDLLTVLKHTDDTVLILTHAGKQGLLNEVNIAKLEESVEIYDELIKEFPKEGRYYTLRASAWYARGNEINALGDFDAAIENGYKQPHAYASRGMFHAAVGNMDKAIADYTKAIALDPKDESNFINRAAARLSEKNLEQAIEDYSRALELKPRTSTLQQRAIAWKILGKPEKAVEDYTAALEINHEDIPSLMGRGFVSFQAGETAKAIEDFSAVISINPRAAEAWNNRGFNRQMQGDFADALKDYAEATRLAPGYALAWVNMAWLQSTCQEESVRDGKQAEASARKACELTEFQDFNALKALAAAFAEQGDFEKAIGWQEKAVERSPEPNRAHEEKLLQLYRDEKPFRVADNQAG